MHPWDFPGGPVVKNSPSNARDVGSIPGQGTKIPHAGSQLSRCITTTNTLPQGATTPHIPSGHLWVRCMGGEPELLKNAHSNSGQHSPFFANKLPQHEGGPHLARHPFPNTGPSIHQQHSQFYSLSKSSAQKARSVTISVP